MKIMYIVGIGKGPSIWDTFVHDHPFVTKDGRNGDISANSYHLYKHDINALRDVGMDYYRFSIAWSRILPTGNKSYLNDAGIQYYNNLINDLLAHKIEPVITMMHYDFPQYLQQKGGLKNSDFVSWFTDYADVLFQNYGDRVKRWITFNEPFESCVDGYGSGRIAPGVPDSGVGEYVCSTNFIKAHAEAYHLYRSKYFKTQQGKIGITLDSRFYFSKSEDTQIIDRGMQYSLGWFANPIYSRKGNYPQIMIDDIKNYSKAENRTKSRLPEFENVDRIRGTADFLGLNYYSSRYIEIDNKLPNVRRPSWASDTKLKNYVDPKWPNSGNGWLYSVPEGLTGILKWIRDNYDNVEVLITENGWSDDGNTLDYNRVNYMRNHLKATLAAIKDGCNVSGYTVWSIIDNFEWLSGFT